MIIAGATSPFEKGLRYVMMVYRQRWAILACTALGFIVSVVFAKVLPEQFESSVTVMIEPQSTRIVGGDTNEAVDRRIQGIEEIIKAGNFLFKVIEKTQLLRESVDIGIPREREDAVSRLRSSIRIGRPQPNMIKITYRGSSSEEAYQVTDTLMKEFEETVNNSLTGSLIGDIKFLEQLEQEYREKYQLAQRDIVKFKEDNINTLPGTETGYLNQLGELNVQLMQVDLSLLGSKRRLALLKERLTQTPEFISDETVVATNQDVFEQRQLIRQLKAELGRLASRVTPSHREYIAAENSLAKAEEDLKTLIEEAKGSVSEAKKVQNPAYVELLDRETEAELQLQTDTSQKESIEAKIKDLKSMVNSIPELEQELQTKTMDLNMKLQAHSAILEEQQRNYLQKKAAEANQGAQFVRIDDPRKNETPVFPNLLMFALGGSFCGLIVGAGIAFVREWFNQTVQTAEEVRSILAIPVLATLPQLDYSGEAGARLTDSRRKDA